MGAPRRSHARTRAARLLGIELAGGEKPNKYRAEAITVEGQTYRSKRELKRHRELQMLARIGEIAELKREVRFDLLPRQQREDGTCEQGVYYVADFTYLDVKRGSALVVEDVKSEPTRTRDYIIKRKLMLREHGITIREVYK